MGVHILCSEFSLVCDGKERLWPFKNDLPSKQYLKLTLEDQHQLYTGLIEHRMSKDRLYLQRYMDNTNRVESYHRSTLKLIPKHKTYRKHYVARCFSSAHTDSVGILQAITDLTLRAGAGIADDGPGQKILQNMKKVMERRAAYSQVLTYRSRRKKLRFRRSWVKFHRRLSLVDGANAAGDDHRYTATK